MSTAFAIGGKFATVLNPRVVKELQDLDIPWGACGYAVYKRTYARMIKQLGRTEDWHETVERCCNGILEIGGRFSNDQIERLAYYWYMLKGGMAGRPTWQLGTDTVRRVGGDSLQNCWMVTVNDPIDPFTFAFNQLMLGGGVGFNILPEHVYELPPVRHRVRVERVDSFDCDYIVTDNREGWVELLRRTLHCFFYSGNNFRYNTLCVRAKGRPIEGFGGVASGPEELVKGIGQIVDILIAAHGRKLRPTECMFIMNIIGQIVVAGNVRRSAEIAIGSVDDTEFLQAKNWFLKQIPSYTQMSNNTGKCSDTSLLPELFWDGYEGRGEAYGLYNEDLCRQYGRLSDGANYRPDPLVVGTNPCVTAGMLVQTSKGPRRVEQLIGTQFDAVVDGHRYPSTDLGFFQSGVKSVYRVETTHGYNFECTSNHEIYTPTGKTALSELDLGDEIELHNHKEADWHGEGTENKGWLVGSLLGDGHAHKLSYWGETKTTMLEHAATLLHGSFNPRSDCGSGEPNQYDRVNIGSVELGRYAADYFNPVTKGLYDSVEQTSRGFYRGFLRGWFNADGSPQGNHKKGISIRLWSVIPNNLYIAQRMLARLGIISTVYLNRKDAGFKEMPGGIYECRAGHELVIAKANIVKFAQTIGFIDLAKADWFEKAIRGYKRRLNRETFTTKISAIVLIGDRPVYDCQIKGAHKFDCNGVKVSNCGEIPLESHEACNLSEIFLPNVLDENEFGNVAELLFMANKAISCLPCWHPKTNEVVGRNHRIGIGVTGFLQATHLNHDSDIFDAVYDHLEHVDTRISTDMKVKKSIKLTTVKPSGTMSLLAGVTPGVHPAFAPFYIRRITIAANDPLVEVSRSHGYNIAPKINIDGSFDHSTMIVDFPTATPEGTQCADGYSAISQLRNQRFLQTHWADNSVSMTCYFEPDELLEMRRWLRNNYSHSVKTASFLLHKKHGFQQAPYEQITEDQYIELAAKCRPITSIVDHKLFELIDSQECGTGGCPVR